MPKSIVQHQTLLTDEPRADLEHTARPRSVGVARKRWATILLADNAHTDGRRTGEPIADDVGLSVRQLERARKRFVREGMGAAVVRATRSDAGAPEVRAGTAEAHPVTRCCSDPPGGPAPAGRRLPRRGGGGTGV